MKSLKDLQQEIGQWAAENFGKNVSKMRKREQREGALGMIETPTRLVLDELAPLMGMMEELGEMFEEGTEADVKDAFADILVYLCDYCHRSQIVLLECIIETEEGEAWQNTAAAIVAALGDLFHIELKAHQGIRGFDDRNYYTARKRVAIGSLYWVMQKYAEANYPDTTLLAILNETWEKVVSKRNWKKDATTGGGHAHTS